MRYKPLFASMIMFAMIAGLLLAGLPLTPTPTRAADHRDSTVNDARPEGDMPDVYALVNPNDPDKLVLALNVNPFINPSEIPSYRFAEDYLYQLKIDNNGDAVEDFVVQATFTRGTPQPYEIRFGRPNNPRTPRFQIVTDTIINEEPICNNRAYQGSANGDTNPQPAPGPAPAGSPTPQPAATPGVAQGRQALPGAVPGVRCFVGPRDDPFVTDVGQAVFRIGLNPNPSRNFNNHEQDVFRQVTGTGNPPFGPLRGRPLDPVDANSGLDGFGGFNASVIAVEIPKEWVRGTGTPVLGPPNPAVPDAADFDGDGNVTEATPGSIPACPGCIGVWATVSVAKQSNGLPNYNQNGQPSDNGKSSTAYEQFERMGQQLFNTVWIWDQPPTNAPEVFTGHTDAQLKNYFNYLAPQHDVENFGYEIPDALVVTADQGAENSITLRRQLLQDGGFLTPPSGVAYLLDQLTPPFNALRNANVDKRLLERLLLPDVLRLDLDRPAGDPGAPGAAATSNSDPRLGLLQFGLQNGRRTADDVTDIVLRLGRELADVAYTPAGEAIPTRRALRCVSAVYPAIPPSACSDARITAVLQGTDFIEPDPGNGLVSGSQGYENVANSGNDRGLNTDFPFFAEQHPLPGELNATTTGFPRQGDPGLVVLAGQPNTMPDQP